MSRIKFGTDGWRAIIAEDYTFDNVRLVAQAVADFLLDTKGAKPSIVVGYDTRFGSERFAAAAAEVLSANGLKVLLSKATTPTPVVSYSILDRHADGAVMITASHNPASYNGFKYKPEYAGSASPEVIAEIERRVAEVEAGRRQVKRQTLEEALASGSVEEIDPSQAYFKHVAELVDLEAIKGAGLNVVVDPMYGAGMGYLPALLGGGATGVTEINAERNPLFGGVNPEPIPKNLGKLMKTVAESRADVGIALDGDADRVGAVDEHGTFINQLQVFALLALYLLEVKGWRGPLVRSLSTTSMVDKLGELYGVPVYETPVGFKYIGPKMMETNAIIGGEESGGFGFRGHIPERDGVAAGLFLLDLMISLKKPMSRVIRHLQEKVGTFYYDRVDLHFPAEKRAEIVERLSSNPPREIGGTPVVKVRSDDGFRFNLADGSWLLIRFSGTEPIMRIYTETTSAENVKKFLAEGRRLAGI